jgi:hypothetical protein
MTRLLWIPFAALAILAIIIPAVMEWEKSPDVMISSWGTWIAIVAVLVVGAFAIPQLALLKSSVETEVFLKATAIIDDEKVFGPNHRLVVANSVILKGATLADAGDLRGISPRDSARLSNAVRDVLYTLEKVGIIFHYSTNKAMIEEYVGDAVISSYEALESIITDARNEDPSMYDRFDELYQYCKKRWPDAGVTKYKYTNA